MQFTLTMKLDNAEVEEAGVNVAVAVYLANVSARIQDGGREGIVRDGNGNTIGHYEITGD